MSGDDFAQSWRDVTSRDARSVLRRVALSAIASVQRTSGRIAALLRKPRVQVLILHHVFPDEEENFRSLLERLSREHEFVSYGEAVRRAEAGGEQIDRPYLTFSFDDGLQSCLRAAAILQEFSARACFFVCPAIIGETDITRIKAFCRDRLEMRNAIVAFMNWDDLHSLRDAGHEIGGHTMTHANLAEISVGQAQDEIGGSFQAINRRLGECRHFAWTFGHFRHCNAQAVKMVYDNGYRTCASGERGCHGPARGDSTLPICVKRDHVVAASPIGHSLHFITQSSARLSPDMGDWPVQWREVIRQSKSTSIRRNPT